MFNYDIDMFLETNINIFYIQDMILNSSLVITFLITNFGENYYFN